MKGKVKTLLLQFNFKNFKLFRDEAALDLSAAKPSQMCPATTVHELVGEIRRKVKGGDC